MQRFYVDYEYVVLRPENGWESSQIGV